jgi:toxin-antitoxin system PIN domain toxin
MNLIDANILLYAYDESAAQHDAARIWLEQQFSGSDLVALPSQSITFFLRISTNPRAYVKPFALLEATRIVSEWLSLGSVMIPTPTDRHWDIFKELLVNGQASGPLALDAHLAALSLENGAAKIPRIAKKPRDRRG